MRSASKKPWYEQDGELPAVRELVALRGLGMHRLERAGNPYPLCLAAARLVCGDAPQSERELLKALFEVLTSPNDPRAMAAAHQREAASHLLGHAEEAYGKPEGRRRTETAMNFYFQSVETFRRPDRGGAEPPLLRDLATSIHAILQSQGSGAHGRVDEAYIGRPALERRFSELLESAPSIVLVVGDSGMGKTTLARNYLLRTDAGRTSLIEISFLGSRLRGDPLVAAEIISYTETSQVRQYLDSSNILEKLKHYIEVSPAVLLNDPPSPEFLQAVRSWMKRDHLVVVTQTSTVAEEYVRDGNVALLPVFEMSSAEATALVRYMLPSSTEREAEALAHTLHCHPLAIEHAALYLSDATGSPYQLQVNAVEALQDLGPVDRPTIAETYSRIYRDIAREPAVREVLEILTNIPARFISREDIADLWSATRPPTTSGNGPVLVDGQKLYRALKRLAHLGIVYELGTHYVISGLAQELFRKMQDENTVPDRVLAVATRKGFWGWSGGPLTGSQLEQLDYAAYASEHLCREKLRLERPTARDAEVGERKLELWYMKASRFELVVGLLAFALRGLRQISQFEMGFDLALFEALERIAANLPGDIDPRAVRWPQYRTLFINELKLHLYARHAGFDREFFKEDRFVGPGIREVEVLELELADEFEYPHTRFGYANLQSTMGKRPAFNGDPKASIAGELRLAQSKLEADVGRVTASFHLMDQAYHSFCKLPENENSLRSRTETCRRALSLAAASYSPMMLERWLTRIKPLLAHVPWLDDPDLERRGEDLKSQKSTIFDRQFSSRLKQTLCEVELARLARMGDRRLMESKDALEQICSDLSACIFAHSHQSRTARYRLSCWTTLARAYRLSALASQEQESAQRAVEILHEGLIPTARASKRGFVIERVQLELDYHNAYAFSTMVDAHRGDSNRGESMPSVEANVQEPSLYDARQLRERLQIHADRFLRRYHSPRLRLQALVAIQLLDNFVGSDEEFRSSSLAADSAARNASREDIVQELRAPSDQERSVSLFCGSGY